MTLTKTAGENGGAHEGAPTSPLWADAGGRGPDVLLVHGALGDYRQWAPIAERLRAQFRVVAVSRRYHWPNRPPPADADYSYESQCDDLLAYLRGYARRVHLVGHSYGAGIAVLVALRAPGALHTLTLIEPPFASLLPKSAPGLEQEVASRGAMLEAVQALSRQGGDEHAARMLVDWLQGGPGRFARLTQDAQQVLLQNAKTVGPTFSRAAPSVACGQLRGIRVPTLVLRGEHTRPYFALIADTTASCLPDASAAQVPGAGHMTIVERPAETAARLFEFLQQAPAAVRD
jgi:pimeloyl-ACP methyl ester carboxylesterase